MTGLMWFTTHQQFNIRHTCEQSDGLRSYGWKQHDGVNFGSQDITEKDFLIRTDFVKKSGGSHGGDWTVRITGKQMVSGNLSTTGILGTEQCVLWSCDTCMDLRSFDACTAFERA